MRPAVGPPGGAAVYRSGSTPITITVDTTISGLTMHQISLYMIDWYNNGCLDTVTLTDANTGAFLDIRTVSAFSGGQYWVWNMAGNITFTLARSGGGWCTVVSGIFFDPTGTSAPDTSYIEGGVPTKTLGLPDDYAFDGWGCWIMYAVSTAMTQGVAFSTIPATDVTTRLTVNDASGNAKTTKAAYVLVSFGPDGFGAIRASAAPRASIPDQPIPTRRITATARIPRAVSPLQA